MLSIPKYPEQYAQHFPSIFYPLCCASQHHVTEQGIFAHEMTHEKRNNGTFGDFYVPGYLMYCTSF